LKIFPELPSTWTVNLAWLESKTGKNVKWQKHVLAYFIRVGKTKHPKYKGQAKDN
jgi:hypothetical protein